MIEESTKARIMNIFERVQNHQPHVPIITQIDELARELYTNPKEFQHCFQQGYLKICKKLKETGCQIPDVFVNVVNTLIQFINKLNTSKSSEIKFKEETVISFNQFQLRLFSQLSMSRTLSIRIFGAKLLFTLLKGINPNLNHPSYKFQILQEVVKAILLLISQRNKMLKRHGLKLASLIQQVQISRLSKQIKYLQNQVLGIIKNGDDEQTRQIAFNNLILNTNSINQFITRLRDKNPKIKQTVFKKLIAANIHLSKIGLANSYKILYDGMNVQNKGQRVQCINFLHQSFGKQFSGFQKITMQPNQHFQHFIRFFEPNLLLQHPLLLQNLEDVFKSFLCEKSTSSTLLKYLKSLCQHMMHAKQCSQQVFYIRVLAQSPNSSYYKSIEQYIPSSGNISDLLLDAFSHNRYFQVCQLIKLSEIKTNSDSVGDQRLCSAICKILQMQVDYQIQLPHLLEQNDVCWKKTSEQIRRERLMMNQHQDRPIHSTIDLIPTLIKTLIFFNSQVSVQNKIKDIIYSLQEVQADCKKETEIDKLSLRKLQESCQTGLIQQFKKKLQQNQRKSKIAKERYIWLTYYLFIYTKQKSFEIFTTSYDVAYSYDRPLAYLLMTSYSLSNNERLAKHFQELCHHCADSQQTSLEKQVSIRCISDLLIRYNLFKSNTMQSSQSSMFLTVTMTNFLFSNKKQMRLVAIEHLCRLLYKDCVPEPMIYFVYLIILWFDTNSPTKSLHLISVFIKNYIEKSRINLNYISEYLQIFILTLNKLHANNQEMDNNKVSYPMRYSLFIKKIITIAMNILKYDTKTGTRQRLDNPNTFGAQQSFVLCVLQEKQLQKCVDVLLQKSDFIQNSTSEQLIVIRDIIKLNQDAYPRGPTKGFLQELERQLLNQNVQNSVVDTLNNVLMTSKTVLNSDSKEVIKNLMDLGLLSGISEQMHDSEVQEPNNEILIEDSESEIQFYDQWGSRKRIKTLNND